MKQCWCVAHRLRPTDVTLLVVVISLSILASACCTVRPGPADPDALSVSERTTTIVISMAVAAILSPGGSRPAWSTEKGDIRWVHGFP